MSVFVVTATCGLCSWSEKVGGGEEAFTAILRHHRDTHPGWKETPLAIGCPDLVAALDTGESRQSEIATVNPYVPGAALDIKGKPTA